MFSRRVPSTAEPNPWFARRRALLEAGIELLDLSESNPTRTGLAALDSEARAALDEASGAADEPDPRGLGSAREAVAAYHAGRGDRVDADRLLLTTGTSEGVTHLLRLLCDPGQAVLVPGPGYPLFAPIAAAEGARAEPYRLGWKRRWELDLGSVERGLAAGARAVFVVEPNHPTASRLDEREWAALEGLCAAHGAAIVADEVFADHGWDPERPAFPSRAGETRVLTFTLGGLSKTRGLPQLKLGWMVVSGPEAERARALEGLEWLADLTLSVAGPVQRALPRLLSGAGAFQRRARERVRGNLASLDAFAARHAGVERLPGEGGWTALLRLPASRDDEAWALELLERGVAVHPGHFYDLEDGPFVVPSLVVTGDTMRAALERLGDALAT